MTETGAHNEWLAWLWGRITPRADHFTISMTKAEWENLFALARRGAAVQAAGWQRRLKHADNGAIPQWELCLASEATDHFNRSPHHEYRQISAALPTPEKDTQS